MLKKTVLPLLVFLTVSTGYSQVNISGTVQDSRTKAPVSDATVKLLGLNLVTSTAAGGEFNIQSTSIANINDSRLQKAPALNPERLLFLHETEGFADVSILDLSGRQRALIFNGMLTSGFWRIIPPDLSPGIYLCRIQTSQGVHAIRFLSQRTISGTATGTMQSLPVHDVESYTGTVSKKTAAPLSVDSLQVSKNGYRSVNFPIDNFQQTGITVLLEDTSASNVNMATIVPDPSWTCFMPDGIPPPEAGVAVFSIKLQYSAIHDVGITKFGHRRQFDISGGTITGTRINGTVFTGGLDYELTLSNGSIELEQINILRADNTPILMRNAGVAPAGAACVRVVLDFEAPNSSRFAWLNTGKFAANRIVDSTEKTIKLDVYDISGAVLPQTRITIKDPENVDNQTWECLKLTGSQGASVFTENVALGNSINIGQSKRGSRNIIPITGGTTTGRVVGKILNGGADYQLSGLDARYTLAPDDGEFIIVRNCGSGALVPVFEARVDGPYNYLNENRYLSSGPSITGGGVSITFYERR